MRNTGRPPRAVQDPNTAQRAKVAPGRGVPGRPAAAEGYAPSRRSTSRPGSLRTRSWPARSAALDDLELVGTGQPPQPAFSDQTLVDRPQTALEHRVHGGSERHRFPIHRPAGRHHDVRVRDQRLGVDRALGHDQAAGALEQRALSGVPGLRELDGIWTNREVTGMKAVPRRLLILGGGPVGAEMAQAVRRLGGEVALVEGAEHVLAREPAPLGHALGEVLRRDGIELFLGIQATAARRDGQDYVLTLNDGHELRGDHLSSPGRRPRMPDGLETVGATAGPHGIEVDAHLRAADRLWAVGDVTGVRLLTHVGKYQGEVVAANILGEPREAHYEAIPDAIYTDPQAASVGATQARFSATALLSKVAKTATYTHAYASSNGFLTLLSDGDHLTGAYALGPEAGSGSAGHAGDPRRGADRGAARCHPALPHLLRDLRRRAESARDQITAARQPAATESP